MSEIDVLSLAADRRRTSTFEVAPTPEDYKHLTTYFSLEFDGEGEDDDPTNESDQPYQTAQERGQSYLHYLQLPYKLTKSGEFHQKGA